MNWTDFSPWGITSNAIDWAGNKVGAGDMTAMNGWFGNKANDVWNTFIDTEGPERGMQALNEGMDTATSGLDASLLPVNQMYQDAMKGRQMGDVLDAYRQNMAGTVNAGTAGDVQNFMNPMYGKALSGAANQALAGAGSSAMSTAGDRAVANAVADKSTSMWNNAFNQAMASAKNKQGVYSDVEQSDLSPSLGWSQFLSDVTGAKYDAQVAQANAQAELAGQDKGWLSSIVGKIF